MSVSDKPSTLRAQMKHHEPIVCFQQNQRNEVRIVGGGGIVGAISANPGMKNQNYLCMAVKTKQVDMRTSEETAHPLDSNDDKEPQAVCYGIDQQGGKSNCGYLENVMPTICSDSHGTPHALCYPEEISHGGVQGIAGSASPWKETPWIGQAEKMEEDGAKT